MSIKPNQGIYAGRPKFKVGDYVNVDGQKHLIEAIWWNAVHSPSGVRLTLKPSVPEHGRWIEGTYATPWVDDGLDNPDDGLDY